MAEPQTETDRVLRRREVFEVSLAGRSVLSCLSNNSVLDVFFSDNLPLLDYKRTKSLLMGLVGFFKKGTASQLRGLKKFEKKSQYK